VRRPTIGSGRAWRGLIGLAAAYAVALQLALSGFLVVSQAASAVAAADVICTEHAAAAGDASGQPSGHHAICPCGPACAMSGSLAVLGGAIAGRTIAWLAVAGLPHAPRTGQFVSVYPHAAAGPHSPRAPPTA